MAGAGFKTFVDGNVLTAAEVNTYLMQQSVMVFADASARSTAIAAPSEGMLTYLTGSDLLEYYDGAAWQPILDQDVIAAKGDLIVGTADDTVQALAVGSNEQRLVADSGETTGLKYVADTTNYAIGAKGDLLVGTAADTVTNLAVGTNGYVLTADSAETSGVKWAAASSPASGLMFLASATPSSVAASNFDSVFSATYDVYLITWTLTSNTTSALSVQYRASGSTNSTSNYSDQQQSLSDTTFTNQRQTGQTRSNVGALSNNDINAGYIYVFNPNRATKTMQLSHAVQFIAGANTPSIGYWGGNFNGTDQFDGISLSAPSGTFTGDIRIYGIPNS